MSLAPLQPLVGLDQEGQGLRVGGMIEQTAGVSGGVTRRGGGLGGRQATWEVGLCRGRGLGAALEGM